jgi:adenylate cyclase
VATFERLIGEGTPESIAKAMTVYRGDLLDGLDVRDPAFEEWLLLERQRLRVLARDALGVLLDRHLANGTHDSAAAVAHRLLAVDPLREAAHRALMQIYAEQGQTALALKQYQFCRETLQRELGVKPEPETDKLYRSIQEKRAAIRPTVGESKVTLSETQAPPGASPRPEPEAAASVKPAVAVLPFRNLSGDPDQQYFSDGITEDIITELSPFHLLRVIPRNSSFQYRGAAVDVKHVGHELGVQYIVEGSVRKAGGQVRISAHLVDATTGSHLWARRYDRELRDVFAIQDEVAAAVVSTVVGEVQAAEIDRARRKRTDSLLAHDFLLRGLELVNRSNNDDFHATRLMFEKAIAIDPNFAQAHALLAIVLVQLFWNEIYRIDSPSMAGLDAALIAAQRAVALDGNDSLCHIALGMVQLGRKSFDLAEHHSTLATSLNPNDADSLAVRSLVETFTGRPDQAIKSLAAAMMLNPRPPNWYWAQQGLALYGLRRYAEAATVLERATARPPSIQRYLAACYAQMDRMAEAQLAVAEALRMEPTFTLRVWEKFETYKFQADLDHMLDGFRKAGLPQ